MKVRTTKNYFYQNYQGSVIGYADASGNAVEIYRYGPWGEPRDINNNENWGGARFRYTGQTRLETTGLYYYKARVYDPAMGRFLQTDPIGSKDDLDLYAYVGDDPINKSDALGLCPNCYIPRDWWAKRPADTSRMEKQPIEYNTITLHHTGDKEKTPQAVESLHRGDQNWFRGPAKALELKVQTYNDPDVGYNFLIAENGNVFEGRPLEYKGEHVAGHNSGNIGIAFL